MLAENLHHLRQVGLFAGSRLFSGVFFLTCTSLSFLSLSLSLLGRCRPGALLNTTVVWVCFPWCRARVSPGHLWVLLILLIRTTASSLALVLTLVCALALAFVFVAVNIVLLGPITEGLTL